MDAEGIDDLIRSSVAMSGVAFGFEEEDEEEVVNPLLNDGSGAGDGSVYQRASDGRWLAVIDLGGGHGKVRVRKTVSAKTRAEVIRKLRKVQQQMDAGVLPESASTEEWLRHWVENIAPRTKRKGVLIRERTLIGYRSYINTWLIPHLGRIRLQHLTPDHVRAMYSAMRRDGRSETTIRQAHAILHRALRVAMLEGRVVRNAAAMQDSPSAIENPTPHLTVAEARKVLAAAAGGRELVRAMCALVLGLRQEEALGLRWEDVDLDARVLRVERAVQRQVGKGLVVTDVKSRTSRRALPLPPAVAEAFTGLRMMSGGEGWVFPGFQPENPTDPRRDYQAWRELLERAGVRHVPLRGARPTAASAMLAEGAPAEVIAEILGHAKGSIKVAEEHYLHTTEDARASALGATAALLPGRQSTGP